MESQQPPTSPPSAPPPAAPPPQTPWIGPPGGPQAVPPGQMPGAVAPWQAPAVPEGPGPGVKFAPHAGRLIAYIIDGFILSALFILLTLLLVPIVGVAVANKHGGTAVGAFLLYFVIVFGLSLAYFPFFWARSGQTPGMRVFHLHVVRDRDGGKITGGAAVLRLFGFWVSSTLFYLGFIWIFVDDRRRSWADLIAGTIVVER